MSNEGGWWIGRTELIQIVGEVDLLRYDDEEASGNLSKERSHQLNNVVIMRRFE